MVVSLPSPSEQWCEFDAVNVLDVSPCLILLQRRSRQTDYSGSMLMMGVLTVLWILGPRSRGSTHWLGCFHASAEDDTYRKTSSTYSLIICGAGNLMSHGILVYITSLFHITLLLAPYLPLTKYSSIQCFHVNVMFHINKTKTCWGGGGSWVNYKWLWNS